MLTNSHTGTRIDEVAEGIYRINTPLRIDAIPGGFNLSQYLVVDDQPVVFHTGWPRWLPLLSQAISEGVPLGRRPPRPDSPLPSGQGGRWQQGPLSRPPAGT